MIRAKIENVKSGTVYEKEFKDYDEMISYMEDIYEEWIIDFNSDSDSEKSSDDELIHLYIYNDYVE